MYSHMQCGKVRAIQTLNWIVFKEIIYEFLKKISLTLNLMDIVFIYYAWVFFILFIFLFYHVVDLITKVSECSTFFLC